LSDPDDDYDVDDGSHDKPGSRMTLAVRGHKSRASGG
jgi:hypothetical protein